MHNRNEGVTYSNMKKKRVLITVDADEWVEAQALIKEAGLPPDFLSQTIRDVVSGILPVMRQAKIDQEEKRQMTKEEGKQRYLELSKKSFDKLK